MQASREENTFTLLNETQSSKTKNVEFNFVVCKYYLAGYNTCMTLIYTYTVIVHIYM